MYFAALSALNGCSDDQKQKFCEAAVLPFEPFGERSKYWKFSL